MNSQPLVSVIIPVYNAEIYIKDCLNSLISQSYSNFEVICVDDGSLDSSADIINEFVNNDNRFKIYSQKNKGQPTAMNVALSHASGDYIMKLDADDFVDSNYIRSGLTRIKDTGADASIPQLMYFTADGDFLQADMNVDFNKDVITGSAGLEMTATWDNIHANLIIKKSVYIGIQYETKYTFGEEVTARKLISRCKCLAYCPGKYYYRVNPTSVTQSFSVKRFDLCKSKVETKRLFEEYGILDDCKLKISSMMLNTLVSMQYYYFRHHSQLNDSDKARAKENLRQLFDNIDRPSLDEIYKNKGFFNYVFHRIKMSSYLSFSLLSRILYLKVKSQYVR